MKMVSELTSRLPPLFLDLSKNIAGDIDCSLETLQKYSNDGGHYSITPQAIIYPKNVTDIRHVLSFASNYTMPVTVRGKGSGGLGGALSEGLVIDMSRYFNGIRHINMLDHIVTIDAGATVSHVVKQLDAWGYEIPPLLESDEETTVGGMFATKSVSPSTFFHGSLRDWVEGLTVVADNGEEHRIADGITPSGRLLHIYQSIFPLLNEKSSLIRAVKPFSSEDAAGFTIWNTSIGPRQLLDQLSGSEGTLGIVTSFTFRVIPKRKHTLVTYIRGTANELCSYVKIAKEYHCDSMFFYDETFQALGEKYHPSLLPSLYDKPYMLITLFKDTEKSRLHATVQNFSQHISIEENLITIDDNSERALRVMSYSFLHDMIDLYGKKTLVPSVATEGNLLKLSDIPSYLDDVTTYLYNTGKINCITGYIGSGHVAVTSLFDPYSKIFADDLFSYQEKIFSFTKKHKGSISSFGGDGLSRTPYLLYHYNDITISIFEKVKKIWDPTEILNPRKKIDVSLSYLRSRLFVPKQNPSKP